MMLNKSFLAFALLHVAVPVICVAFFGANPVWVIGSLILSAAIVRSIHPQSPAYLVTTLSLVSGLTFALTLMLGTAYYMQGEGFNDSFFYHFNSGSIIIAARSYGSTFYPALIGLILAFLAPVIFYKTSTQKLLPGISLILIWGLALLSSYPAYSLIQYEMSLASQVTGTDAEIPTAEDKPPATNTKQVVATTAKATFTKEDKSNPVKAEITPKPKTRKNIILIYAESLESLYFETEIFGDLLPNIKNLSANAHRFTNLRQVRGTDWTIAGIVASQCGFPLIVSNHLASNSSIASVEKPYPDEICLADILTEHGYETVYMGGAPLWFGGKGNFLKTHGYQRIYGDKELISPMSKKKYQSGWGLYDDSLFALALNELNSLEQSDQPYLLTLLTLDTHHPYGLSSKSCKKLADNSDSMSNAIYCSDQLISKFISEAMEKVDMDDTIIVLFSDHLSLRNTLWDKLKANKQKRRLTFMIFDHKAGTESRIAGTHFDVGPTVLEAAGIADQLKIGAGSSLFSQGATQATNEQLTSLDEHTPILLKQNTSAKETGVNLSKDDLTISVGNLTLKANESGQKFISGMYLAVFDNNGNVIDAIHSDDYELLAKNINGKFVVGISILESQPGQVSYFYGRISPDGRGIVQKPLNENVLLSANEVITSM